MSNVKKSSERNPRSARILLVEDNPADVEMVMRFLDKSKIRNELTVVTDGEQALEYLYRKGSYSDRQADDPQPDVILLDLNLPGVDGRDVLSEIKQDEKLNSIPVVVLTTSDFDEDIEQAYEEGANSYIVKPVTREQFFEVIDTLEKYWFQIVVLPDEKV